LRDGIRRKPEAKSRADEQKPHIRQSKVDEFAKQNKIPKDRTVKDLWSYCPSLVM